MRTPLALAFPLSLSVCGGDATEPVVPDPPVPTQVVVTPGQVSLEPGDTARLAAEVRDQYGEAMPGLSVTWASADTAVATVDVTGVVTGIMPGEVEVTASLGGIEGGGDVIVTRFTHARRTLSSGEAATCALDASGAVYCWGDGLPGVGPGEDLLRETPTEVTGGHRFVEISVGSRQACGLTAEGDVLCWGANRYGEVDAGLRGTAIVTPTKIPLRDKATQVEAGRDFTCALLEEGDVYCWGRNNEGQLGRGTVSSAEGVGKVDSQQRFAQLALGHGHACALTQAGVAYCWGRNSEGQLGNGSTSMATSPVAVEMSGGFEDLATSRQTTCAVSWGDQAYCWGDGASGMLGNGGRDNSSRPVPVVGLPDAARVAVGSSHACALDRKGHAYCWGMNRYTLAVGGGVLGTGDTNIDVSDVALAVAGGVTFSELTSGGLKTCGREESGGLWCWGVNVAGGLGVGGSAYELVPAEVGSGRAWTRVEAGTQFGCGLDEGGALFCWGSEYGRDGHPVALASHLRFRELSVGPWHACAIARDGRVHCWGSGTNGRLGDGTGATHREPVVIASDSSFVELTVGVEHSCATTASGATYCWGDGNHGRFGNGHSAFRAEVPIPGVLGVSLTAISLGYDHGCGLDQSRDPYCWGSGPALGSRSTSYPQPLPDAPKFRGLSAGNSHTCGVDLAAHAWCWGAGHNGRLGQGSTASSSVPVLVSGGLTFAAVDAGVSGSCGVATSGEVHCWGSGLWGELGHGLRDIQLAPVRVSLDVPAVAVSLTRFIYWGFGGTACALTTDHRVFCWGANDVGQAGQAATAISAVPLEVTLPGPM